MSQVNIIPLHKDFRDFSSGSSHSTTYTPYVDDQKAFQDFTSFSSGSSHSSLKDTGYQYYQELLTYVIKVFEEGMVAHDSSPYKFIGKVFEEGVGAFDGINDGFVSAEILIPIGEEWVTRMIKTFEEGSASTDAILIRPAFGDNVPIREEWIVRQIKVFEEKSKVLEYSDAYELTDITDTIKILISKLEDHTDTIKVQVSSVTDKTDSVAIGVIPQNLAAVSGASGNTYNVATNPIVISYTDSTPTPVPTAGEVTQVTVNNPFEPTVILGGTTYVSNSSTSIPASSISADTYFVQWLDLALPNGQNSCTVQDFSFNLGFEGGNFSVLASDSLGTKGSQVDIFGLQGTITRDGEKLGTSAYGYITKGIFGSPKLNKEFNIINYGNQNMIQFIGNQTLYPLGISKDQRPTVWDMARQIAVASGVSLGYYVVDSPYTDTITQAGLTGLESLGSLAAQVGAQLRWSGNNSYSIVYPNHYQGRWEVPDESLITADGPEYENILDLGLGVTGTGVLSIPKANVFNTETDTTPTGGGSSLKPIRRLYTIRSKIEANDPPLIFELPQNVDEVKYQTIVASGQETSAINGVVTDFDIWQDIGNSPLQGSYHTTMYNNGAYVPVAIITNSIHPDITPINNGNFVTYIGITERDLTPQFEKAQEDERDRLRDLINRMNSNIRYIKTYEGTISCYFFGSIPLPGMWASATVCSNGVPKTIEGIVESVSFNHPGILTIGVAQYLRVNFLDSTLGFTANPSNFII